MFLQLLDATLYDVQIQPMSMVAIIEEVPLDIKVVAKKAIVQYMALLLTNVQPQMAMVGLFLSVTLKLTQDMIQNIQQLLTSIAAIVVTQNVTHMQPMAKMISDTVQSCLFFPEKSMFFTVHQLNAQKQANHLVPNTICIRIRLAQVILMPQVPNRNIVQQLNTEMRCQAILPFKHLLTLKVDLCQVSRN